jgi:hypothetical protein
MIIAMHRHLHGGLMALIQVGWTSFAALQQQVLPPCKTAPQGRVSGAQGA